MLHPQFTFAFQPIVDIDLHKVVSYEALIRGPKNESAREVLGQVPSASQYVFDEDARIQAIRLATQLGITCDLNLNFLPQSLYSLPGCILSTVEAAQHYGLPVERITLEVTEGEIIDDQAQFAEMVNEYRRLGMRVAIDDFGAGYSGLNLLADFQPDQIKLDMKLVRGIARHGPRQAILRAIAQACGDLGIDVLAEGVETIEEFTWLSGAGIRLFQGYLFGRPSFETLSSAWFPTLAAQEVAA